MEVMGSAQVILPRKCDQGGPAHLGSTPRMGAVEGDHSEVGRGSCSVEEQC